MVLSRAHVVHGSAGAGPGWNQARRAMAGALAVLWVAGSTRAEEIAPARSADELWGHIESLERGPQGRPATREEAVARLAEHLAAMQTALATFGDRYPDDARQWRGQLRSVELTLMQAAVAERAPDTAAALARLRAVAEAEAAPAAVRTDARFMALELQVGELAGEKNPAAAAAVDAALTEFQDQHPADPRREAIELFRAQLYETSDPAKAETALRKLADSKDTRLRGEAERRRKRLELARSPIALSFTAVDGREVDLAGLRGKVVLVDFWATWCGPCLMEMPNVIAAYEKYHGQGFEVVGISLDKDKAALLRYLKDKGMTWPQYFDGKGWENEISRRYGIAAIPAMWLLDKTGKIRSTDARGAELARQVEKLLAE